MKKGLPTAYERAMERTAHLPPAPDPPPYVPPSEPEPLFMDERARTPYEIAEQHRGFFWDDEHATEESVDEFTRELQGEIVKAIRAEREACAQESLAWGATVEVAAAIRARGENP